FPARHDIVASIYPPMKRGFRAEYTSLGVAVVRAFILVGRPHIRLPLRSNEPPRRSKKPESPSALILMQRNKLCYGLALLKHVPTDIRDSKFLSGGRHDSAERLHVVPQ